jgi:hypothetical protein
MCIDHQCFFILFQASSHVRSDFLSRLRIIPKEDEDEEEEKEEEEEEEGWRRMEEDG